MRRLLLIPLLTLAMTVFLLGLSVPIASAAPTTATSNLTIDGTSAENNLGGVSITCDPCLPDALFSCGDGCEAAARAEFDVHTSVKWTAPVSIESRFDPDQLHQGNTANIKDTLTPGEGPIRIRYRVHVIAGVFARNGDFPPGPGWTPSTDTIEDTFNLDASTNCTPPIGGTTSCVATNTANLLPASCILPPGAPTGITCPVEITIDLVITHTFTISPAGVIVNRSVTLSPNQPLSFTGPAPSVVNDSVLIPCSAPVGSNVSYGLGPATYSPSVSVAGESHIHVFIDGPGPANADEDIPIVSGTAFSGSVPMTAPAAPDFALGTVLADNVAPTITMIAQGGVFVEGSDTTFTAVATDNCAAALDYEWRFSDGGVGFNSLTHHTFADNGNYTLDLRVTDAAGNGTSTDRAVNPIANANPLIAPPLPNASAEWGVPVQFHADAIDPGPADQPTLVFRWNFGDGSSAAGADVSHSYANPGSFAVMVTVQDKDGGLGTGTLSAVISKRGTTTTYTGPTQSLPSKYVSLSATLVDDLGQPVAGGLVVLALGAQTTSGTTDASGMVFRAIKLNQRNGTYVVSATFAENAKYFGSSNTDSFLIGH